MYEDCITNADADGGHRVPWREHHFRRHPTDFELFSFNKEVVPLRAVRQKFVTKVVEGLPELLYPNNFSPGRGRHVEAAVEVSCRGEVISVGMSINNPIHLQCV